MSLRSDGFIPTTELKAIPSPVFLLLSPEFSYIVVSGLSGLGLYPGTHFSPVSRMV